MLLRTWPGMRPSRSNGHASSWRGKLCGGTEQEGAMTAWPSMRLAWTKRLAARRFEHCTVDKLGVVVAASVGMAVTAFLSSSSSSGSSLFAVDVAQAESHSDVVCFFFLFFFLFLFGCCPRAGAGEALPRLGVAGLDRPSAPARHGQCSQHGQCQLGFAASCLAGRSCRSPKLTTWI